jgi:hypothetical protein
MNDPKSKVKIPNPFQTQMSERTLQTGVDRCLAFEVWSLFGIWDLDFGF